MFTFFFTSGSQFQIELNTFVEIGCVQQGVGITQKKRTQQ